MRFEQINTRTQRKITTQATDVQKFRDKRNQWESSPITQKGAQPTKGYQGVTQPTEHKGPVSVPVEHKGPVMQPTEHKGPVSQPAERKGSVNQPADNAPAFVSPRNVRATKSEKVKVPQSPIVGKSVNSDKSNASPPSKPVEERQRANDTGNKDNRDKGRDKGK